MLCNKEAKIELVVKMTLFFVINENRTFDKYMIG